MSSSMVTCPHCEASFDVAIYAKSDTWGARPLGEKPKPWVCDHCGYLVSFNDESRPWLGLKAVAPVKCCKYHDNMVFVESDLTDCAMSGMGCPIVCCLECPDNNYPVDMPIYYATNIDCKDDRAEWEMMNA